MIEIKDITFIKDKKNYKKLIVIYHYNQSWTDIVMIILDDDTYEIILGENFNERSRISEIMFPILNEDKSQYFEIENTSNNISNDKEYIVNYIYNNCDSINRKGNISDLEIDIPLF